MELYDKYLLIIIIIVLIIGVIFNYNKHIFKKLIVSSFNKNKIIGSALFIVLSTIAILLLMPVTPFNIIALYLYNPIPAILMAILAHITSAVACFYVSKYYQPQFLEYEFEKFEIYDLLKSGNSTQSDKLKVDTQPKSQSQSKDTITTTDWFILVVLTRLSPNFPYGLISYMWGTTNIPISIYLIGTILGCIPFLIIELYLLYNAGQVIAGNSNLFIFISIIVTFGISYSLELYSNYLIEQHKQKLKLQMNIK